MADLPSCPIWLVSVKYILAWKDKSSELRDRLHCFRNKITGNLVGIQAEQGPRTHDLNCLICGINHPCEWREGCMDQQCEDSHRRQGVGWSREYPWGACSPWDTYKRHPWCYLRNRKAGQECQRSQCDVVKGVSWCWEICSSWQHSCPITEPESTCNIVAVRLHTICHCHYRCRTVACDLAHLYPLIRQHV